MIQKAPEVLCPFTSKAHSSGTGPGKVQQLWVLSMGLSLRNFEVNMFPRVVLGQNEPMFICRVQREQLGSPLPHGNPIS